MAQWYRQTTTGNLFPYQPMLRYRTDMELIELPDKEPVAVEVKPEVKTEVVEVTELPTVTIIMEDTAPKKPETKGGKGGPRGRKAVVMEIT